jgi:hypothetical protein
VEFFEPAGGGDMSIQKLNFAFNYMTLKQETAIFIVTAAKTLIPA